MKSRAGAVFVGCLGVWGCNGGQPEPDPTLPANGGYLKGILVADLEHTRSRSIALPDLTLTATDALGAVAGSATTDVDGRFVLGHLDPGAYEVCWSGAGWVGGCYPAAVTLGALNVWMGVAQVQPDLSGNGRLLYGDVRLGDGSLCSYRDGASSLGDIAVVQGLDAGGAPLGGAVRTNRAGGWALPESGAGFARVQASCGGALGEVAASGGSLDLAIADYPPRIVTLTAYSGGASVSGAGAGETVALEVQVSDNDGDDGVASFSVTGGSLSQTGDLTADWTLPSAEGTYAVEATVTDARRGGQGPRSRELLYLRVGEPRVVFAGEAVSAGSGALSGLEVTVNGEPVQVGADGRFFGALTPAEGERYVLNASADAHVPVSEVLDRGARGGVYTLQPASQATFQAEEGGRLVVQSERKQLTIEIPGGALERVGGGAASGAVTATFGFLDPSEVNLPGDYAARQGDAEDSVFLDSYGAAYVDLRDASGAELDLAEGASAQVSFPMPTGLDTSSAPPTIPIWTYDTERGVWRDEPGVVAELSGGVYQTKVSHFSYLNMDIANDEAACVRIKPVYQQLPSPNPRLRVIALQADGVTEKTKILNLDQNIHAVLRLIPGLPVRLEVLDEDGNVFADLQATNDAGVPLNAAAIIPTYDYTLFYDAATWPDGDLWPPAPYVDCTRDPDGADPDALDPDQTIVLRSGDPSFQGFPGFLSLEGAAAVIDADCSDGCDDGAVEAEAYYALVDPNTDRENLGDWWAINGFDDTTGLEGTSGPVVEAAYLNAGDLGSGRNMRCVTTPERVACYVGNYGGFDLQPGNADLAEAADQADAFATVCMEYAPVEVLGDPDNFVDVDEDGDIDEDDRIVKFFVYFGGDPGADRSTFARLDNTYARYSPRICMVCHGGELPAQIDDGLADAERLPSLQYMADPDNLSVFREFDVETFGPPTGGLDLNALRELNQDVITQTDLPPAIEDLVAGWYGGSCGAAGVYDNCFTPDDWGAAVGASPDADQEEIYQEVVAPVCRACHVAQYGDDASDGVDDNDYDLGEWSDFEALMNGFDTIEFAICDAYYMPHGEVPFNRAWYQFDPIGEGPATLESNPLTNYGACDFEQ